MRPKATNHAQQPTTNEIVSYTCTQPIHVNIIPSPQKCINVFGMCIKRISTFLWNCRQPTRLSDSHVRHISICKSFATIIVIRNRFRHSSKIDKTEKINGNKQKRTSLEVFSVYICILQTSRSKEGDNVPLKMGIYISCLSISNSS